MSLESYLLPTYEKRLERKKSLTHYLKYFYPFLRVFYGIKKVVVSDIENVGDKGPLLILPKHTYNVDFLVMYEVLQKYGNHANYVMKASLPSFIVPFGAIKIIRGREYRKIFNKVIKKCKNASEIKKGKYKIRAEIESQNKESLDYIEWLYRQKEIVLAFPEGTTVKNKVGNIRIDEVIRSTIEAQKNLEESVYIIPIGLRYDKKPRMLFPTKVYVGVGKPLIIEDFIENGKLNESNLVNKIKEEITKLSGF